MSRSLKKLKREKEQTAVLRDVGETIQRVTAIHRARIEEQKERIVEFRESLLAFASEELPLEVVRPELKIRKSMMFCIGPERGLVGNLHRSLAEAIGERRQAKGYTSILVAGSRLCGFLETTSNLKFQKYKALSDRPQKSELQEHAKFILDGKRGGRWNSVELLYPTYQSITEFKITTKTLLPLEVRIKKTALVPEPARLAEAPAKRVEGRALAQGNLSTRATRSENMPLFFIEPSMKAIIRRLEHMIFETELYEVFLEARFVELSQRLLASTRTTENAKRILKTLQRQYLRVQRARTTKTINEIFTGRKAFEAKKRRGAGVALEWVV